MKKILLNNLGIIGGIIVIILLSVLNSGLGATLPIFRIPQGGTGTSTQPTDGQLLIGSSGGGYLLNTLTAGTNITIANASGTITINSSGGGGGGVESGWRVTSPYIYLATSTDFVGIGTTTPAEQLQITGNLRLPQTASSSGVISGVIYSSTTPLLHSFGITNNSTNVFLGGAGNFTASGASSNFGMGANALLDNNSNSNNNVAIGAASLRFLTSGTYNVGIGASSGYNITGGDNNIAIGTNAIANALTNGDNNTAIGYGAGYQAGFGQSGLSFGNVFLGYNAGYNETKSNKLYIANSSTSTFIYGNFANKYLSLGTTTELGLLYIATGTINPLVILPSGYIGINTTTPSVELSVQGQLLVTSTTTFNDIAYKWPSADGSSAQVLSTSGTGQLSWVAQTGGGGTESGWRTSGSNVYVATTTDYVGIGTTTPLGLLHIATGTLNPFFVSASGYIGIGTTTPTGLLHIATGTTNGLIVLPSGGVAINTSTIISSGIFQVSTSSLVVMSNGKVGLGTTAPTTKLDVAGTGLFTAQAVADVPLTVKGAASQTGNLFNAQNSTGQNLTSILSDGSLRVNQQLGNGTTTFSSSGNRTLLNILGATNVVTIGTETATGSKSQWDIDGSYTASGTAMVLAEMSFTMGDEGDGVRSPATNGATMNTTGDANGEIGTADFATGTDKYIDLSFKMPGNYEERTNIAIEFIWISATTSGNVVWGVQYGTTSDDVVIGGALTTAATSSYPTADTSNKRNTHIYTITGHSIRPEDYVIIRILRNASNANDTINALIQLLQVHISFYVNS